MVDLPAWRAKLEHHALWVSLGAILAAGAIVAVGIQVAPETFYDRFWWEDIYGPLVVDARQCSTAATCTGLEGPQGIVVKDGYTVTSELTYGLVLAVMLYGIYVGLFRRFQIIADGWFVLGLLPWIMLGPLSRVLEDANVFCRSGSVSAATGQCDPGPFAYAFISPVIYLHIAVYVIAALLLGVYIRQRAHDAPGRLTAIIGSVLGAGLLVYAYIGLRHPTAFSALVPLWFAFLASALALGIFHWRAREGHAGVNLTTFVLGLPFALGSLYLIARWLSGDRWSEPAWNGNYYLGAGALILALAALTAGVVYALGRRLGTSPVAARWGVVGARIPPRVEQTLGWSGVILLTLAILTSGLYFRTLSILRPFAPLVEGREDLITPVAALGGVALLGAFVFAHVGRELGKHATALLVFTVGINVALVFAHLIDGLATWFALFDPFNFGIPQYSEKHPFSDFLLGYLNGFLFPVVKLLMVLVVAWMLDRETRTTGATSLDSVNMVGLVKMAIFVLGFAPGLRDVLRLSMGV